MSKNIFDKIELTLEETIRFREDIILDESQTIEFLEKMKNPSAEYLEIREDVEKALDKIKIVELSDGSVCSYHNDFFIDLDALDNEFNNRVFVDMKNMSDFGYNFNDNDEIKTITSEKSVNTRIQAANEVDFNNLSKKVRFVGNSNDYSNCEINEYIA